MICPKSPHRPKSPHLRYLWSCIIINNIIKWEKLKGAKKTLKIKFPVP